MTITVVVIAEHSIAIISKNLTQVDQYFNIQYYSKKLRAAKLRGIFSEGLLVPVGEDLIVNAGDDYTQYFGVTKYEYPIPQNMNGNTESPIEQYKFPSPEILKRYQYILHEGEKVVVTEKVHGSNFTIPRQFVRVKLKHCYTY